MAMAICVFIEGEFDAAVLVVPSIVMLCLALIAVITRNNSFLFKVMIVALLAKLFAAWTYASVSAFQGSDTRWVYFETARQISASADGISSFFPLHNLWGTNAIIAIGAYIFALIGPSLLAAMVLFAVVSFWGQFLFYCAFTRAFPAADCRPVALALFFFPSIVYWTATFGKDALMLMAIGLITYGVARRFDAKGWMTILVGFVLASVVRPHVGAFLSISLFVSYLMADLGQNRKIVGLKFLLFPLFLAVCCGVVIYARSSLEVSSLEDAQSMSDYSYKYNQVGGSAFGDSDNSMTSRLAQSPFLMFRPFPWETNNGPAAIASCEGSLLLFLVVSRRSPLLKLVVKGRSIPLVAFTVSFFLIFSLVFSISLSNFGLLARQRVMVLPLVLLLLLSSKSPAKARQMLRAKHA